MINNVMAIDYTHKKYENSKINNDVLFIHGALSNKSYWLDNVDLILEIEKLKPNSLTAISLMGRGESELSENCSVDNHINEIINVIKKLNLSNIVIISHSFGTPLSLGVGIFLDS